MNRSMLLIGSILLLLTLSCSTKEESKSEAQPNVVLFLIDDYGYGDISFEGNTQIKTPHIDRIAEQGAHFTRFYQSSGACAPTRASLLTGRYYLQTGVWGVHFGRDFLRRDETTIADILKKAGYTTGAFGKWHSGKMWRYFSWNRGFDVGVHPVLYRYWDTRVIFNNKLVNADGPIADVVGNQVVKFIRDNKDRPFFAYVPFQSIHEPSNCPDDVFRKYKAAGYSDHVARMYGMIEVMDNNVGKIINAIEELQLSENTVVMFMVDDGPSPGRQLSYSVRRMNAEERQERERAWSRKLRGGKASIYEGGSISPFYIMWKGRIEPLKEYTQLAGVIDVLPTVLDICNVELPEDNLPLSGRSFWPVIQEERMKDWDERKYYDNTNFYRIPRSTIDMDYPEMREISVHYKNYKLVRTNRKLYGEDKINFELFDLAQDPGEEENLFAELPELAMDLKQSAEKWYDDIVKEGRAFPQAVFEVGHWEERGSPINLDAVKEIRGSVKKSDQSEFRFDGWTTPGSAMTFDIDVVETGNYVVELLYSCPEDELGAQFRVYTEHDTAGVVINDVESAKSDVLILPQGPQTLTVELVDARGASAGVEIMRTLVVHRIPGTGDGDVLQNPGFRLYADDVPIGTYYMDDATTEFLVRGGSQDPPEYIKAGAKLRVEPMADNMDQLDEVELFLDFESFDKMDQPPYEFGLTIPETGKYTLNVEFTSKQGVKNAARALLVVN